MNYLKNILKVLNRQEGILGGDWGYSNSSLYEKLKCQI